LQQNVAAKDYFNHIFIYPKREREGERDLDRLIYYDVTKTLKETLLAFISRNSRFNHNISFRLLILK